MAIRRIYKKRFKGVVIQSGYFYKFEYQAWENDPKPTVIIMYAFEGINTRKDGKKKQWRFFQAINFSYVPRAYRRRFVEDWKRTMMATKNPKFTWQLVKRKYPFLQNAVRRYFYDPTYYIANLKEIPFDDIEKIVVSTWSKDFSKKVKTSIVKKFRDVLKRRQQYKRTGKFPRRV